MSLELALREYLNVKRCYACRRIRHADDFGKDKWGSAGLRSQCRDCTKAYNASRREAARERYNEKNRLWSAANRDKHAIWTNAWRAANPERFRQMRSRIEAKRKSTVAYQLHCRLAGYIRRQLRGGKAKVPAEMLVDWSIDDLRQHLERQFTKGMGWHNMDKWHIDHIVPTSSFNISSASDPDFRKAWALSNLRPLWASENSRKGAKRTYLL